MIDDYDEQICHVCLESYDLDKRIPKKLECCNKAFCLICLEDIFKINKSLICPICRVKNTKTPNNLKIASEYLKKYTICPTCHKSVSNNNLKISIVSGPIILCDICSNDEEDSYLKQYIMNLIDEMNYFRNTYCDYDKDNIYEIIDNIITNNVEKLFDKIKKTIHFKIKERFLEVFEKDILKTKLDQLFEDYNCFNNNLESLINIKELNNSDFIPITQTINFYINKNEKLSESGKNLNRLNQILLDLVEIDDIDVTKCEENIVKIINLNMNDVIYNLENREQDFKNYNSISKSSFEVISKTEKFNNLNEFININYYSY